MSRGIVHGCVDYSRRSSRSAARTHVAASSNTSRSSSGADVGGRSAGKGLRPSPDAHGPRHDPRHVPAPIGNADSPEMQIGDSTQRLSTPTNAAALERAFGQS